jgi:hypothetical protein
VTEVFLVFISPLSRSQWPRGCWVTGSNPAEGMDVCLLCLYVVLSCLGRDL